MRFTVPMTACLLAGALLTTSAYAQNEGNLDGRSEAGRISKFAYLAKQERSVARKRDRRTKTSSSQDKAKRGLNGLSTNSICIGCSSN